jgi:hypothetical protein
MYILRLLLNRIGLYGHTKFQFIEFVSTVHEKVVAEILEDEKVADEMKLIVSFEINALLLCFEDSILRSGLSHLKPLGLTENVSSFYEEVVDQIIKVEVLGCLEGRRIDDVNGDGVSGYDLVAERIAYHNKNLCDVTPSYLRHLEIMLFKLPLTSLEKIKVKAKLSLDFLENSKRTNRLVEHIRMINGYMKILEQEIKFIEK